jgi:hypothetical protein
LLAVLLSGCFGIGANRLQKDRFDYNAAIADSTHTQTLLAIVKLRYLDWPVFVEVEQIVAQYTYEHTATAKALVRTPWGGDNDQGEAGWVGKFSERPAIMYKPLRGSKYMKSMLTPAPIASILALIHTGWPADRIFETFVGSVNSHSNVQLEQNKHIHPDLTFARFIKLLRSFQIEDALVIDIKTEQINDPLTPTSAKMVATATHLGFRPERVSKELQEELAEAKQLLGLEPGANRFNVTWGAISNGPTNLAFETRSMVELMVVLAANVQVPEKDLEEGRVPKLKSIPKDNTSGLTPLMTIRSGSSAPSDAYASCEYRGQWFWIEDTDLDSKMTFAYLSLLLTLGDVDDRGGTPLVLSTN